MVFKNIEWELLENTDDYIIYTYRLDLGIISYLFNYGVCYGKYFVDKAASLYWPNERPMGDGAGNPSAGKSTPSHKNGWEGMDDS